MRVVLDSNVLLSALIRIDSNPYKLVRAWLDGRFELISSPERLDELSRASVILDFAGSLRPRRSAGSSIEFGSARR
jgi:predicted nucleic acid-binding protein